MVIKKIKCFTLLVFLLFFLKTNVFAQSYNNNPKLTFINHDVPKSPESSSFEKYGKIPVGHYTGVPNIGIPLYTIQGNGFSIPINLSYHASGIKVAQEATWVGLGWDLVPGGRITLEVKGGYDKNASQYLANQVDRNILGYLFEIGNYGNPITAPTTGVNRVFGSRYSVLYSTVGGPAPTEIQGITYGANLPTNKGFDRIHDFYTPFIKNAVDFGVGEPDVFHVNVLGKSFDFYKDLLTDKIIVKGEKNLYIVTEVGDSWEIKDDEGISYHFYQQEKTHYVTPLSGHYPEITTSWLLTKIVSANGDEVNYTYENYGDELTAPSIAESETKTIGETQTMGIDAFRSSSNINSSTDLLYIKPQYLRKIESKNVRIDFSLGLRNDIGGAGARKLDEINIISKQTNELLRSVKFNYDYTGAETAGGYYFNLALLDFPSATNTSIQDRMKWRLRLNTIDVKGSDLLTQQRYEFSYNPLSLPSKVSISQDHWGYYNGKNMVHNGMNSSVSFTPSISSLVSEGIIPSSQMAGLFTSSVGNPGSFGSANLSTSGLGHANRAADGDYAQAGMLTTIKYPTGGSTSFEYELHRSSYKAGEITGGGLRAKKVSDFIGINQPATITTYSYVDEQGLGSGTYMGSIEYLELKNYIDEVYVDNNAKYAYSSAVTLFSNGNLSTGGPTVAYRRVVEKKLDAPNNENNGSIVRTFNLNAPNRDVLTIQGVPNNIDAAVTVGLRIPPVPKNDLDGVLLKEEYFDRENTPKKEINNYYTQHNLLDTVYSIKISDHKLRQDPISHNVYYSPVYVFEPVRSYRTTLDSTVTNTFENGQSITTRIKNIYNTFNQREYSITSGSDNSSTIEYVSTPLSYTGLPALPTTSNLVGNALAVQKLKLKNMLHLPIEHTVSKKKGNGTEAIIAGSYNLYDNESNVKENYQFESDVPVLSTLYQKSSYNSIATGYDISKDSRYKLKQTATYYNPSNYLKQINENGALTSFIVDLLNDNVIATAKNANHTDIAYTSFENTDLGNWSLTGGSTNSSFAHSGGKSFNVAGGTINKTVGTSGSYIVSYWSSGGTAIVNGANGNIRQSINGWNLYEHKLSLATNGSITLTGNLIIDDLRLYPEGALFTTYTYKPLVGLTSQTDVKGMTTSYTYDSFNRLENIRDQNGDVVKNYRYGYADGSTPPAGTLHKNREVTIYKTRNNCGAGQQSVPIAHIVPANTYSSTESIDAADQVARTAEDAIAQAKANNLGVCTTPTPGTVSLSFSVPSQFKLRITNTATNIATDYIITGTNTITNIPSGTVNVTLTDDVPGGAIYSFNLNGEVKSGNSVTFNGASFAVNATLTVTRTSSGSYFNTTFDIAKARNNCSNGLAGSTVNYTVVANQYSSTISVADANEKARIGEDVKAQTNANNVGVCAITSGTFDLNYSTNSTWMFTVHVKDAAGNTLNRPSIQGSRVLAGIPGGTGSITITPFPAEVALPAGLTFSYSVNGSAVQTSTPAHFPGLTLAGTVNVTVTQTSFVSNHRVVSKTKNDCPSGQIGSVVSYTVPAQISTISQADADQKALTYGNANAQAYANANGTCTTPTVTYYNAAVSASFVKNNCPSGQTSIAHSYNVPYARYNSTISQADANQKAQDDINANGQNYVNTQATCIPMPFSISYAIPAGNEVNVYITNSYTNEQSAYVVSGTGTIENIPGGTGTVTVSCTNIGRYSFELNGTTYPTLGTYSTFGPMSLTGNMALNVVKHYYNTEQIISKTRNNCASGYNGSAVNFTVAANTYSSAISQADANQQARTAEDANAQANANANGTCTPPPTYYNAYLSVTKTRNNCTTAGYTGSSVTYTVPASRYSSLISQADANQKAQADADANAQNYANTNGACNPPVTYSNTGVYRYLTKNNCPPGDVGGGVTYVVNPGKYTSTISQADANQQAQADLNANAQNHANANGTCTTPIFTLSYSVPEDAYFVVKMHNPTLGLTSYHTIVGTGSLVDIRGGAGWSVDVYPQEANNIRYEYSFLNGGYLVWGNTASFGANLYLSGNVALTIIQQ